MNDSDGPGSSQPPEPHLCVQHIVLNRKPSSSCLSNSAV